MSNLPAKPGKKWLFPPTKKSDTDLQLIRAAAEKQAPSTFFLNVRRRAENTYNRLLNRILKWIDDSVMKCTDPADLPRLMQSIINSPRFDRLCRQAAQQMATMLAVGQKASWREAARASSQGRRIYKALMKELNTTPIGPTISATVEANAKLIKTVPQTMAKKFSALAKQRRFEGVRHEDIMQEIQAKAPHLREFEAKRIARTESAKASTALIQARAESWGLNWYKWASVNDERTRDAHRAISGIYCQWSDPPNPEAIFGGHNSGGNYHPGCIYNCRCQARPVLDIEDIKFPAKFHVSGHIETINSRKAFEERFSISSQKEESGNEGHK